MDGQLDECDLMLKEVHQIEASLTKSLTAIYHPRIAYPSDQQSRSAQGEKSAEAESGQTKPRPNGRPGPGAGREEKAGKAGAPEAKAREGQVTS